LIDHVIFVGAEVLGPAFPDELDDPSWVQVHAEADTAPILGEVFHREPEAAWTGRPQHQPVRTPRKELVWKRLAEDFVVDPEVVERDTRLRGARGAAGFEDVDRFPLASSWNPAIDRAAAQPFVFKRRESFEIRESPDLATRIPSRLLCKFEPERTAGGRIEVPVDHLADPRVEFFACGCRGRRHLRAFRQRSRLHGP